MKVNILYIEQVPFGFLLLRSRYEQNLIFVEYKNEVIPMSISQVSTS